MGDDFMEKRKGQGRLIVFEGPDGVGKTALSKKILTFYKLLKIPAVYCSFPGQEIGTLGKLVYEVHHQPQNYDIESVSKSSLQILHLAAHIDLIESKILPAIQNGVTVVLDRYWWSTIVYGEHSGVDRDILDRLIQIEKKYWQGIKPYRIFFIHRTKSFKNSVQSENWRGIIDEYNKILTTFSKLKSVISVSNEQEFGKTTEEIFKHLFNSRQQKKIKRLSNEELNQLENEQLSFSKYLNNSKQVQKKRIEIIVPILLPAKPTIGYEYYWKFAVERQKVFFNRFNNAPSPWTKDPVLSVYKFTNAYRALDRVSQYLIKEVIYKGSKMPEEVLFRIILFKIFNKIETWELLKDKLGQISYKKYNFNLYDSVLSGAFNQGTRIYSAAYIMASGKATFGFPRKHQNHLQLIESMMKDNLARKISKLKKMSDLFDVLKSYSTIGDFLAYQYATDINYSELTDFSEMEFVVPGPGALSGIKKCFSNLGGLNEVEIIKYMADIQEEEFKRLGLEFKNLWGRKLQLIDCQNLFCETDKYLRVVEPELEGKAKRARIKQKFKPLHNPINYWFPPKWDINDKMKKK